MPETRIKIYREDCYELLEEKEFYKEVAANMKDYVENELNQELPDDDYFINKKLEYWITEGILKRNNKPVTNTGLHNTPYDG